MAASSRPKRAPNNFLEALRELGQDTVSEAKIQVKKIVTSDIPQSLGISGSGTLKPNESVSMEQIRQAEMAGEARGESKAQAQFNRRMAEVHEEERRFLQQRETQNKQQILSIQQEIKLMARTVGEFNREVEIATTRAVVNPGVYHKNFFEHLRVFIATMRQRVESSKHWLATSNSRAKKQGFYWGQVKKSGTKYMLSSERYMVTSTG
jgi:hypothetical protein